MSICITINNQRKNFDEGISVLDALKSFLPQEELEKVLCVKSKGTLISLSEKLDKDVSLVPVTYQQSDGRRVYERSLRFLFLLSMKRVYPDQEIRIVNSVSRSLFLELTDGTMTREMVSSLEADMRLLVSQEIPFEKLTWTKEKAIVYFTQNKLSETADLISFRENETVDICRLDGFYDTLHGCLLPHTGYLKTFSLQLHFPGAILNAPSIENPSVPQPYSSHARFLRSSMDAHNWSKILGAQNAADVNRMILSGSFRQFIRVNEALHDKVLSKIADEIKGKGSRIVMVFGPSSSGKTTFANRLCVHLTVLGITPRLISLDDFYRNKADLPLEADGKPDLESVHALDIPLLTDSLSALLSGKTTLIPRYNFQTSTRDPKGVPLKLEAKDVLIVEGIHGMNDLITCELPEQLTYGIYVSPLGCVSLDNHNRIRTTEVRLLRRIVRDSLTRNTSPAETIAMWPSVRAGEEKWIFPNQEKADVMFNTSLHYELPVLKTLAYSALKTISPEDENAGTASKLIDILDYFLPADELVMKEIPPLSILREFLGNCSFYDKH